MNVNGFEMLLKLMMEISRGCTNLIVEEYLKTKIEKDYANLILKIIKLLIMSVLAANNPNQEMVKQFSRKMS